MSCIYAPMAAWPLSIHQIYLMDLLHITLVEFEACVSEMIAAPDVILNWHSPVA